MADEQMRREGAEGITLTIDRDMAEILTVEGLRHILLEILDALDVRAARILRRRYGLDTGKPATLHAIGREEGVTRERIRQIEQTALAAFRREQESRDHAVRVRDALYEVLRELGGTAREDVLARLVEMEEDRDRAGLRLLLAALPDVRRIRETHAYQPHFRLQGHEARADMVHEHAVSLLNEANCMLSDAELLHQLHTKLEEKTPEPALRSALSVSRHVIRTPYGEWGLRGWPEATPRGVADKAYIVLKRAGKPLHFSEISKVADKAQFDHRRVHPQTVHNELIRDDRFVLVGRGLYALREWGYESGTVADVIVRMLQKAGRPMTRNEIMDGVLKQRVVRKNTVLLALQNRDRFERLEDGTYTLRVP